MMDATDYVVWGIVIHLVVDWLFQNDWMARNKASLLHAAAWVHSGLHTIALMTVFPISVAIALGLVHIFIDTRKPLEWWRRLYRQTDEGSVAIHVAIWGDQVVHIVAIALAALVVTY